MAEETPRIATDIDFEKVGKQTSYLNVAISTNESAYGTVTVPITIIKNGTGPTIYCSGGVHGDEYEGPIVLRKIMRQLEPSQVNGRIIIIPSVNLPAVLAGERCSPIDGLNLNRVYPGSPNGSITMTIAHYVCNAILPLCDIQVDLHSGGKTLQYIPCVIMTANPDKERHDKIFEAMKAFGAPIGLINVSLDDTGTLDSVCAEFDILKLETELGGGGIVSRDNVALAETGMMNLFKHFGIVEGEIVTPEQQNREPMRLMSVPDARCYVMSPDDGLYEPFVELDDTVEAGQPIGQVHYIQHINKDPWVTHTERSGVVLCKRPPGKASRGDNVAIIGQNLT